jgi:uncharacterized protein YjbI with pentapeptide repeats
MYSETVEAQNYATVDWEDNHFKFCQFRNFSVDGKHITSDFLDCSFVALDWYWGLFNLANFVNCEFTDCVFRGTAFSGCKFVECILTNCQFTKDNLGGNCDFDGGIAYGCIVNACEGFEVATYRP